MFCWVSLELLMIFIETDVPLRNEIRSYVDYKTKLCYFSMVATQNKQWTNKKKRKTKFTPPPIIYTQSILNVQWYSMENMRHIKRIQFLRCLDRFFLFFSPFLYVFFLLFLFLFCLKCQCDFSKENFECGMYHICPFLMVCVVCFFAICLSRYFMSNTDITIEMSYTVRCLRMKNAPVTKHT